MDSASVRSFHSEMPPNHRNKYSNGYKRQVPKPEHVKNGYSFQNRYNNVQTPGPDIEQENANLIQYNNHFNDMRYTKQEHNSRYNEDRKVGFKSPSQQNSYRGQDTRDHDNVRILAQDDDWGNKSDRTTNTTSETAFSVMTEGNTVFQNALNKYEEKGSFTSRLYASFFTLFIALIVFSAAFISPIVMIILPHFNVINGWKVKSCGIECDGLYISICIKIILAMVASWAIFFRSKLAVMPRNFTLRTFVVSLSLIVSLIFWIYYTLRILMKIHDNYFTIVSFAQTFLDTQLLLHYVALLLLEIRQIRTQYSIEIVRSPDGETKSYLIGQFSIQRSAVLVLQHYYNDFSGYNPHLERYAKRREKLSTFRIYNMNDNEQNDAANNNSSNTFLSNEQGFSEQVPKKYNSTAIKQRMNKNKSRNDRFYEELEYDRRVQRRKIRLISAAEEGFANVRRLNNEITPPLTSREAAESIFSTLGSHLKKYLRITRQQQKYNLVSILDYLSLCLNNDIGPKGFVNRYLTQGNVIYNIYTITSTLSNHMHRKIKLSSIGVGMQKSSGDVSSNHNSENAGFKTSLKDEKNIRDAWTIVSADSCGSSISHGTVFRLKQADISLLITVRSIPQFHLQEQSIGLQDALFTLVMNSETSV